MNIRVQALGLCGLLLFVSFIASGQSVTTPTTAEPAAKALEFTRERFDPTRDAAADLNAAVLEAQKSGRRIILDVGGEWCGWCVYMDKFFYQNPELAKLRDENFVWLKVNMSPQNENKTVLGAYPTPMGYPHLIVLDRDGKLLHSQETGILESGKGYHLGRFTEFLKKWSPARPAPVK